MTQSDFGTIDPATKSGSTLASDLNGFRTAVNSNHSGASRPSYVIAGMIWLDTSGSNWLAKLYDGADDIVIARIDPTNNLSLQPPRRQEVVKTADYTIVPDDAYVSIIMNKSSAGVVNLPALSGTKFEVYFVRNIAVNPVTIDPNGSEQIEGVSSITLNQGDSAWIWVANSAASWRALISRTDSYYAAASRITSWVSYTPTFTGVGTVTSLLCRSRRVGPNLEIEASWTNGTTTGTDFSLSLGFNGSNGGLTIDTFWNLRRPLVGEANWNVQTGDNLRVLGLGGASAINISVGSSTRDGFTPVSGAVLGNGTIMFVRCSVPIDGWN